MKYLICILCFAFVISCNDEEASMPNEGFPVVDEAPLQVRLDFCDADNLDCYHEDYDVTGHIYSKLLVFNQSISNNDGPTKFLPNSNEDGLVSINFRNLDQNNSDRDTSLSMSILYDRPYGESSSVTPRQRFLQMANGESVPIRLSTAIKYGEQPLVTGKTFGVTSNETGSDGTSILFGPAELLTETEKERDEDMFYPNAHVLYVYKASISFEVLTFRNDSQHKHNLIIKGENREYILYFREDL